jgi:competence protein ComEA
MLKIIENKLIRLDWSSLSMMLVGFALISMVSTAYAQTQKPALDLNTASQKELETLKGVGHATAKKIIAGRPYSSVDDLSKAGVPAKTIAGIKPFVTVGKQTAASTGTQQEQSKVSAQTPPNVASSSSAVAQQKTHEKTSGKTSAKLAPGQKVDINTATKDQLEALPEIGPVKAQAIIDGRPYKKAEDIMRVKGIKQKTFDKIKDFITVG